METQKRAPAAAAILAATLTGVLAFSESMGPLTAPGILCVLAGVYILR